MGISVDTQREEGSSVCWPVVLPAWGTQEVAACSELALFLSDPCVCLSSQSLLHLQT